MRSKSLLAALAFVAVLGTTAPAFAHANAGPDINRELMMAAASGQIWRVKYLVENGANVNWRDEEGYTPLTWAAQHGHAPVAEYLISRFAQVNPTDKAGYTPLMWAAQEGHVTVLETLLKKGANPWVVDRRGANAMTLARWSGNERVYSILRESAGAADARVNTTWTPPAGMQMTPATSWTGPAAPAAWTAPAGTWTAPVNAAPPAYWTAPAYTAPAPRPVVMYEPISVKPPIYEKYQAAPLNKDHASMLARKSWAVSRLADESYRFRADYGSYVQATASYLSWETMGTLNDPDMEVGKYLNAMYGNLMKGRDLARARRDLGRAKNIQDARGETLFSRYIIEADKILRDAGW